MAGIGARLAAAHGGRARELLAEVGRVPGVLSVDELLLAQGDGGVVDARVPMSGLELPRIAGLVGRGRAGAAARRAARQRSGAAARDAGRADVVPVPVVPEEC